MNHKNENGNIIFRASGVHALLTNKTGAFSESNQKLIDELTKKSETKQLTKKQSKTLDDLIKKKNKPFELSDTAKTFIEDCWRQNEYGYREPMVTKETMKGNIMENDSIKLAVEVLGVTEWVSSNKDRKSNEYFTGEWDALVNLKNEVWEIKTCYNLRTFMNKKEIEKPHKTQVNVYCDLLNKKNAKVIYTLVKTPPEIVEEQIKSFWFKFGCDDDNLDYQKIRVQIMHNNNIIDTIPKEQRIKVFPVTYDDELMSKLKKRISGPVQDFYKSIEVNQIRFRS